MPLAPSDIAVAKGRQDAAAHDRSSAVRLVAGPGTGKSSSIEERFRWLLDDEGIDQGAVFGVSFTRAAAKDLKIRVGKYLDDNGVHADPDHLKISTLHSLALGLLSKANLLGTYPVRPRVLDEWEVEHVFDAEFRDRFGYGKTRAEEIRKAHEAIWNTGQPTPPGYIAPDQPITNAERGTFLAFHLLATQTYAAVLPGEIVRLCVEQIAAGHLELRRLADIAYLIVDEYQDLNPMDIRLVDQIGEEGVDIFAAGDDDQSIYSFRFAAPGGIQDFTVRHPGAGDHILEGCFRCAYDIVDAAERLITNFSPPERIDKDLDSLWRTAAPPTAGKVLRWRAPTGTGEAELIANSARALIAAGLPARNIMILLSTKQLLPPVRRALEEAGVAFTPPKDATWADTDAGRFALAIVRRVIDAEDYMALRLILGCRRGIGIGTCASITQTAAERLVNYQDLFLSDSHDAFFERRAVNALTLARQVCADVSSWTANDELGPRHDDIRRLIVDARRPEELQPWDELVAILPAETTLEELRDYLSADNPEQQETLLKAVFERLEREPPPDLPEPRVRVMTMHGAKGLQADVVFIPGLEESIMPGPRRAPSPGLIREGARMLYVSMTRARAALILSYSQARTWQGTWSRPRPSQYITHVAGAFGPRTTALDGPAASEIVAIVREMNRE